jgi:DNA invertase Pin-like site-specific DNA recombinase
MRIAAIYARVSSEQQREANTVASQTSSLIEFAQEHDLEVPKSGSSKMTAIVEQRWSGRALNV